MSSNYGTIVVENVFLKYGTGFLKDFIHSYDISVLKLKLKVLVVAVWTNLIPSFCLLILGGKPLSTILKQSLEIWILAK